jgi:hypothetical protein
VLDTWIKAVPSAWRVAPIPDVDSSGVRDRMAALRQEWPRTRDASIDVTYLAGGVEETFAPQRIRTDQVSISETGAAVHVGQTIIRFTDDAYITPSEGRKLADALVELADWADGAR